MTRTVSLWGETYTIDLTKTIAELEALAIINTGTKMIYIAKDQPEEQQVSCLIHELIEAINLYGRMGLWRETKVKQFERYLFRFVKDNGLYDAFAKILR